MTEYSKFNMIYRLQRWLDSVPGQTFLNYAYSWGASIVILGTLFKLTHLPGANVMLYLGMGTEVIVFFISAFDRPFDKTAIGKDIPTHVTDDYLEGEEASYDYDNSQASAAPVMPVGSAAQVGAKRSQTMPTACGESQTDGSAAVAGAAVVSPLAQPVSPVAQSASPEMEEATTNYIDELKKLTETLAKVSEQSERLTRDSEEMENLNRTLTGICKVYEMQLKGASSQIGTIDEINEQSRRMAQQIEQLNRIYARMIEAMTVNMRNVGNNGTNAEV